MSCRSLSSANSKDVPLSLSFSVTIAVVFSRRRPPHEKSDFLHRLLSTTDEESTANYTIVYTHAVCHRQCSLCGCCHSLIVWQLTTLGEKKQSTYHTRDETNIPRSQKKLIRTQKVLKEVLLSYSALLRQEHVLTTTHKAEKLSRSEATMEHSLVWLDGLQKGLLLSSPHAWHGGIILFEIILQ